MSTHSEQPGASTLLVVDDDATQRSVISRIAQRLGYETTMAVSFDEAAELITDRRFDCITVDLSLGEHDGIELLRLIGELRPTPKVVVISGCDTRILNATVRMAHAAGIMDVRSVPKPVDFGLLRTTLAFVQPQRPASTRDHGHAVAVDERDLARALANDEFFPVFQPKVDLATGKVVGCEALARWRSPELGMVSPELFIPLAERSGHILPLTQLVLTRSIAAASTFTKLIPDFVVAVNLSATLLTDLSIPKYVRGLLADINMSPSSLMLEVTESTAMSDVARAIDIILRLRLKGIGVSMDDFGTGYSSLSALARMPFSELKIDRSFVRNCQTDPDMWKIVRGCVAIGHEFNMKVVAEGIEDEETWHALAAAGCDLGQGFVISAGLTEQDFFDWAARWQGQPWQSRSRGARNRLSGT
ncbi:EAL domain-containing response regulator [Rhodopseudomonas sp. P2A-2r]|uniref:EAL domain-containing response regulator n=1 Tax=unclassified Rhodopseudomonas TaxID=2638247 RepID=UPI002234E6FD|nr:EAL domain-containing response regulator [Rhodopseudomonas sp. P2A-2r]UZE49323.1 EAL domain-containing response regulator [Rhodopseudomonas sp. P2A-2r]